MNRRLLGLLIICIGVVAFTGFRGVSQSLQINSYATTILGDDAAPKLEMRLGIENKTASAMDVGVYRILQNELAGTENYFCWTECYSSGVDTAPAPINIPAGGCVNDFIGDHKPKGVSGRSVIRYCFYDFNDITDTTCIAITYDADSENGTTAVEAVCSTTGIDDYSLARASMGSAQPNPANNVTYINYDLGRNANHTSRVFLYDMLGVVRKEVPISENTGSVRLDVVDLPVGMYFYSLEIASEVVSTKRLLITE